MSDLDTFICICRYNKWQMAKLGECSPIVWGTWVQYRSGHTKDFKMVLDTSLLNTQYYKVRIKGKVEQSRERSGALTYTSM